MKDFEIRITYCKDTEELDIRKSYYDNDGFIDIKNMQDVKIAVCDYLDELEKDLGDDDNE